MFWEIPRCFRNYMLFTWFSRLRHRGSGCQNCISVWRFFHIFYLGLGRNSISLLQDMDSIRCSFPLVLRNRTSFWYIRWCRWSFMIRSCSEFIIRYIMSLMFCQLGFLRNGRSLSSVLLYTHLSGHQKNLWACYWRSSRRICLHRRGCGYIRITDFQD